MKTMPTFAEKHSSNHNITRRKKIGDEHMNTKKTRTTLNYPDHWDPNLIGQAIKVTLDEEGNTKWHFAKEGE